MTYHIELTAADVSALHDIANDSFPTCEEDWEDIEYHISRLEHDGLVERDYDEGWQLSNEGAFAYFATSEIQANSPICIFFTSEEVQHFSSLSEEEQASYFPYVVGELVSAA